MSQVIRDVVIRIGLQQVDNKLQAPDTTPLQKAIQEAHQATIKVQAESVVAQKDYLDEKQQAHLKSLQTIQGAEREAFQELQEMRRDDLADHENSLRKQAEKLKKHQDELFRARTAATDFGIKSADSFRTAAEGALTLARSFALFTSSDKDLEVIAKRIMAIQGGIDLFRGSTDIIKGTVEGYRALTTATKASSTATSLATTIQLGYAGATTTATAATNGLTAAIIRNPIGLAVVGISAAAGALILYATSATSASKKTDDLSDAQGRLIEKMQAYKALSEGRLQDTIHANSVQDERTRLELMTKHLSIQGELQRIEEERARNFGFRDTDQLKKTAQEEERWAERYGKWADEKLKHTGQVGRDAELHVKSLQDAITAYKEMDAFYSRDITSQQRKLELLQQQTAEMGQAVNQAMTMRDVVNQQLAAEKAKSSTYAEQLGRLDEMQKRDLQVLSQKAQSGQQLSREELQQLESVGGTGVREYTSEQFRQMGQQNLDLLSPFQEMQRQRESSLEQQRDHMSEAFQGLQQDAKALREEQSRFDTQLIDEIDKLRHEQREVQKHIEFLKGKLQGASRFSQ